MLKVPITLYKRKDLCLLPWDSGPDYERYTKYLLTVLCCKYVLAYKLTSYFLCTQGHNFH